MNGAPHRCLLLHTGGTAGVEVTASVGARQGPLLRWLGAGWGLELGVGLQPALELLDAGRLPDGRAVSAWWVKLDGERPSGTSGDLVLAATVLAKARGEARASVIVTGSGSLDLDERGRPVARAVVGWEEKLRALETRLAGLEPCPVLLLCPLEQADEVRALLGRRPALAAVTLAPIQHVSDLAALRLIVGDAAERPPGWPSPSPEVHGLLERARGHGSRPPLGYLGVEHLALALVESDATGPALDLLKAQLSPAALRSGLGRGVVLVGDSPARPTPRLVRLGAELRSGFDAESLAIALCRDPDSPLTVLAGQDLLLSLPTVESLSSFETVREVGAEPEGFGGVLEVLGGPEDGTRLLVGAGDTLGRWAPEGGPTHGLYRDTKALDRGLSRIHVQHLGEGRLAARQPIRLLRAGQHHEVAAGASMDLQVGDVLKLSAATALKVPEDPGAGPLTGHG